MMHCNASDAKRTGSWPGWATTNDVSIAHDFIAHGENSSVSCPDGYTNGSAGVIISCWDGYKRLDGWCGDDCTPGMWQDNGAKVYYPVIRHSKILKVSCPAPFVGNIT